MRHGRRRHKKREQGSIELNLAAMLDMAFQLLTFFILTFKPAPVEGQLALNLPPPVQTVKPEVEPKAGDSGPGDVLSMETLHLNVLASENGDVNELRVEQTVVIRGRLDESNSQALDKKLQTLFAVQHVPFDRIQIAVDGRLRYGELMKIIDVCHRQKLPDGSAMQKISFTEVDAGGGPGTK